MECWNWEDNVENKGKELLFSTVNFQEAKYCAKVMGVNELCWFISVINQIDAQKFVLQ